MSEYEFKSNSWGEHWVECKMTRKPKKITATRFGAVLGLNPWKTPFETWCEITRVYEKPFEDTIYTKAGKIIEPKIIKYLKDRYFLDIKSPSEVYGERYFDITKGDFYPLKKMFGGMWDAIGDDIIVEIKTTKRAEDWIDDIPIYYKLQAALYAWLSRKENVWVVCAFLDEDDYINPQAFEPTIKNTIIRNFRIVEEFPKFEHDYLIPAMDWWDKYVEGSVSPSFDEKKDKEILDALRTAYIDPDADVMTIIQQIEDAQAILDENKKQMDKVEKTIKTLKDKLKKVMMEGMSDQDTKANIVGNNYSFILSKTTKTDVDKKALERDGLLYKYQTNKVEYRLNVAVNKGGK